MICKKYIKRICRIRMKERDVPMQEHIACECHISERVCFKNNREYGRKCICCNRDRCHPKNNASEKFYELFPNRFCRFFALQFLCDDVYESQIHVHVNKYQASFKKSFSNKRKYYIAYERSLAKIVGRDIEDCPHRKYQ